MHKNISSQFRHIYDKCMPQLYSIVNLLLGRSVNFVKCYKNVKPMPSGFIFDVFWLNPSAS